MTKGHNNWLKGALSGQTCLGTIKTFKRMTDIYIWWRDGEAERKINSLQILYKLMPANKCVKNNRFRKSIFCNQQNSNWFRQGSLMDDHRWNIVQNKIFTQSHSLTPSKLLINYKGYSCLFCGEIKISINNNRTNSYYVPPDVTQQERCDITYVEFSPKVYSLNLIMRK